MKHKKNISLSFIIGLLLIFSLVAGCGGGGSSGGGSVNPTDSPSPSPSPTSTTGNLTVNGVVRDENGFPIQGATVTLESSSANGQQTSKKRSSSDNMGEFSISQVVSGTYNLHVSKDGRYNITIQNYIITNTSIPSLSVTQPTGSGTLELNAPGDISVTATASGDDVNLSWSQSSASGFEGYIINRSTSEGVTILDDNVGKFTTIGATSMTDSNLSAGTYYYKVFQIVNIQGYQMIFASNEANVSISSADVADYNVLMVMQSMFGISEDTGRTVTYGVCPSSLSGTIAPGKNITVGSPVFSSVQSMSYNDSNFKKIKYYYFGNPVTYCGEVTDYMSPGSAKAYYTGKSDVSVDSVDGIHAIYIDGTNISFNFTGFQFFNAGVTGPSNYDPPIGYFYRDNNGKLRISWNVYEPGIVHDGSGNYDWRFLVQVNKVGAYSNDETYWLEKQWSNFDTRNLSIRNIQSMMGALENLPQPFSGMEYETNEPYYHYSVTIPDGIFQSGDVVNIEVTGFSKYLYGNNKEGNYNKVAIYMIQAPIDDNQIVP